MQRELHTRPARPRRCRELVHLRGVGHAGGVAQRDAKHAHVHKTLYPAEHIGLRHIAFHGAAKHTRQRYVDGHLGTLRHGHHLRQRRKRLLLRHAQVGQVVCGADRHDEVEFVSV
ncbi:hypothetical protein D3C72_2160450 [compost metagenome]